MFWSKLDSSQFGVHAILVANQFESGVDFQKRDDADIEWGAAAVNVPRNQGGRI
jgi:hypothetical protein